METSIIHIPPKPEQIADTMQILRQKLENKAINRFINAGVKEGYLKAVEILEKGETDLDSIATLKTVQGKAIAFLALDYLKGECKQDILVNIPIKER